MWHQRKTFSTLIMTFLFHSYSLDHYKWNINFILLLIEVNKNYKMNVLKMNPRGAMTPCHCHRDLLLTLNFRKSGGPKQNIGKCNYYWVVHMFPNKVCAVKLCPYTIAGNPPLVSHTLTGRGPINWTFLVFMNIYISIHHAIRKTKTFWYLEIWKRRLC